MHECYLETEKYSPTFLCIASGGTFKSFEDKFTTINFFNS